MSTFNSSNLHEKTVRKIEEMKLKMKKSKQRKPPIITKFTPFFKSNLT